MSKILTVSVSIEGCFSPEDALQEASALAAGTLGVNSPVLESATITATPHVGNSYDIQASYRATR